MLFSYQMRSAEIICNHWQFRTKEDRVMFTGSEDDPPPLDSYVRDIELGKSFPLSVTYGTEKFTASQAYGPREV